MHLGRYNYAKFEKVSIHLHLDKSNNTCAVDKNILNII